MTSRPPAVAGAFYDGDPERLRKTVCEYIREGQTRLAADAPSPRGIIVPHAGYIYSGSTAGVGFAALAQHAQAIKRVIVLGPAHRVPIRGIAVPSVDSFDGPLGTVSIDEELRQWALAFPFVQINDQAHALEHSLEVQQPFLQETLGDFTWLPMVVGAAHVEDVAELLSHAWDKPDLAIVISSDLSHYLDYASAQRLDAQTRKAIETMQPDAIDSDQACGQIGVRALLKVAKQHHAHVHTLDICNSGDTAGDRSRVVGYGAWAVTP